MPKLRSMSVRSLVRDREVRRRMTTINLFEETGEPAPPPLPPKPPSLLPQLPKAQSQSSRLKRSLTLRLSSRKRKAASEVGMRAPQSKRPSDADRLLLEAAKDDVLTELLQRFRGEATRRPQPSPLVEGEPSRAALGVSGLRIPLSWPDHFRAKGDNRVLALWASLEAGGAVVGTQLAYPIDRTATDVHFPQLCLFPSVAPGFVLSLSLYSLCLNPEAGSLSERLRKGSLSRNSAVPGLAAGFRFRRIASAKLSLADAEERERTFDLKVECADSPHAPPLFGHFAAQLTLQPESVSRPVLEGGGLTLASGQRRVACGWARLGSGRLSGWRSKDDVRRLPPLMDLPVGRKTVMQVGRRGASLILTAELAEGRSAQVQLTAEAQATLAQWQRAIRQQVADARFWGVFAERRVEFGDVVEGDENAKPTSKLSLYDQISIGADEGKAKPIGHSLSSPQVGKPSASLSQTESTWSSRSSRASWGPKPRKTISAFFHRSASRAGPAKTRPSRKVTPIGVFAHKEDLRVPLRGLIGAMEKDPMALELKLWWLLSELKQEKQESSEVWSKAEPWRRWKVRLYYDEAEERVVAELVALDWPDDAGTVDEVMPMVSLMLKPPSLGPGTFVTLESTGWTQRVEAMGPGDVRSLPFGDDKDFRIGDSVILYLELSYVRADKVRPMEHKEAGTHERYDADDSLNDFTIQVDGECVKFHKLILSVQSEYFKSLVTNGLKESQEGVMVVEDFSAAAVRVFKDFCYCKKIFVEDQDMIRELCRFADKYQVKGLKKSLAEMLAEGLEEGRGDLATALYAAEVLKDQPKLLRCSAKALAKAAKEGTVPAELKEEIGDFHLGLYASLG